MINAATTGNSLLNAGIQALNSTGSKTTSSGLCPVVATTAGIPAQTASAVCTFSKEGLDKLSDAAESGVQAITDAVEDTGEWVAETVEGAARGAMSLYTDIANLADSGIDAVGDAVSDAASATADGIGAATNAVSSYGALALAAAGALLGGVS